MSDKLKLELIDNCRNLLEGRALINSDIWKGNPHPIHEYFTLFTPSLAISNNDIRTLASLKIRGVNISMVYDVGWGANTIRVDINRARAKLKKITLTLRNKWFCALAVLWYTPRLRLFDIAKYPVALLWSLFSSRGDVYLDYTSCEREFLKRTNEGNPDFKFSVISQVSDRHIKSKGIYFEAAGYNEYHNYTHNPEIKLSNSYLVNYHQDWNGGTVGQEIILKLGSGTNNHIQLMYKRKSTVYKVATILVIGKTLEAAWTTMNNHFTLW